MEEKATNEPASATASTERGSPSEESALRREKPSCSSQFEAFYSCYSPKYQMSQYYRVGELDTCFGRWDDLYDCLTYGTKFEDQDKHREKPCIWKLKDYKTAKKDWDSVFNKD